MKLHSITIEENCPITVGETVHVDYDTMNVFYKGEFQVSAIEVDNRGRIEVEILNDKDESAWIDVSGVEF